MTLKRKNLIILFIIIISILIVLLAPFGYHVDLGPGPNSITAMLWEYSTYYSFRYLVALQYYIQFYIFRIVILYAIIRFLGEKLSRKWLIILGVIGELIPLILSIPASLILNSDGENFSPIIISIPFLLLFVIVVAFIYPKLYMEPEKS
ncbi:MAG: hypothetical protein KGD74_02405 [Candidatus Lokiarchaeota archaeon]|nr:hypothetical protein [Candidatus Lokiarchaeota archaeon]